MAGEQRSIEICKETDIGEILAIERDSFPTPWSEKLFGNELASSLSKILVARCTAVEVGSVAGYIVYWRVADEIHLQNLAVRSDLRRRGIASQLLSEMMRASRLEKARRMTLEVRRSNLSAQRIYETFGFAVEGVRPGYYSDNGDDALIMWADLDSPPPERFPSL
jgi:ribosomal-protein-alanine N-acetyltransferase